MKSIEEKIKAAVLQAAINTKVGETISMTEINKHIILDEAETRFALKQITADAIAQLAKKGIIADISDEQFQAEIDRQIAVNSLAAELDEYVEGDLIVRLS